MPAYLWYILAGAILALFSEKIDDLMGNQRFGPGAPFGPDRLCPSGPGGHLPVTDFVPQNKIYVEPTPFLGYNNE